MRTMVLLCASMVFAVLLASGVALVVPKQEARAAFPGSNGKIAFVSNRDGDPDIYTMSPTGKNLKRLTNNTTQDYDPSWSPNGKKIVFSARQTRFGDYDVHIMNADGTNKKLVTDESSLTGSKKYDLAPTFSPDGRKIFFFRAGEIVYDIYTINTDGSGLRRLTHGENEYFGPVALSPDGTKMAVSGGNTTLFVMNSDGTDPAPITGEGVDGCLDPNWSPDGTRITCEYGNIFVMNADGSERAELPSSTQYGEFGRESSAFSPSGTKIVMSAKRDGDYDIYKMNGDGLGLTRIANSPVIDQSPDWQPVQ